MSFSPDGPAAGRWLSFAGDCRPCVQQRSCPLVQAAHRLPPMEQVRVHPFATCFLRLIMHVLSIFFNLFMLEMCAHGFQIVERPVRSLAPARQRSLIAVSKLVALMQVPRRASAQMLVVGLGHEPAKSGSKA